MRYNESPSRYIAKNGTVCEWRQMPDTYSSPSLLVFLYDLRRRLSIDDGGGGYLINAKKTLDTLQYNVRIESYNSNTLSSLISSRISNSSSKHKIAIMAGNDGTVGHAWVCDGYRCPHYYTEYILYALDNDIYPECEYIKYAERRLEGYVSAAKSFHMNWGWGGYYDGWFLDGDWTPDTFDFTHNKRMLHQ
ncbi:MAG: C10 family peptidase [Candidatus Cryptobacteroides sp.]